MPRALQLALSAALLIGIPVSAGSFWLYNQGGDGQWHDVNKLGSGDYNLCWAASAANLLDWGGWGTPPVDTDEEIYDLFVASWTDQPSLPMVGITWWLTGAEIGYGSDWASVDVPGNGGYWTGVQVSDYYHETTDPGYAGVAISHYLQQGFATSLAIYTGSHSGHALTVWGLEFDGTDPYSPQGIYFTDSDDAAFNLQYSTLHLDETKGWWTLDSYQNGVWHIGAVEALEPMPEPAPVQLLLFAVSLAAAWRIIGRRCRTKESPDIG